MSEKFIDYQKMSLAQLGYHLLLVISVADGSYDKNEGRVIWNFINENYTPEFDFDKENKLITSLKPRDIALHFREVSEAFYLKSTPEQRAEILNFIYELMTVDNDVSPEENKIYSSLTKFWNSGLQPF